MLFSLNRLQEIYSDYAFVPLDGDGGEDGVEANNICSIYKNPDMVQKMESIINSKYDENLMWFYIVFKPYNRAYIKDQEWFKTKGLDQCRKLVKKPEAYVLVREVASAKIHVNMIVCSDQSLMPKDGKSYCSKYKMHVSRLRALSDRQAVLNYVIKENMKRSFAQYSDYLTFRRQK